MKNILYLILTLLALSGVSYAQTTIDAIIADGDTIATVNLGNNELLAIQDVDGTWDGATLTLYASSDETNYAILNYEGSNAAYTFGASGYLAFSPAQTASILSLIIDSDVAHTDACTLKVIVGDVIGENKIR